MGIIIAASESPRKKFVVQELAPGVAPDFLWVMATVKVLWPDKTAEALCDITGSKLRTVKYWLAGVYAPRGAALLRLLRAIRRELEERLHMVAQFELRLE